MEENNCSSGRKLLLMGGCGSAEKRRFRGVAVAQKEKLWLRGRIGFGGDLTQEENCRQDWDTGVETVAQGEIWLGRRNCGSGGEIVTQGEKLWFRGRPGSGGETVGCVVRT